MRRREFIALFGAAAVWPFLAHGQKQNKPAAVIGLVHSGSPEPAADAVAAFRNGLAAQGYIEGANFAIEYLWRMTNTTDCPPSWQTWRTAR
jgi:putative tryptophan/tyrosine transport system substrate-binding protein